MLFHGVFSSCSWCLKKLCSSPKCFSCQTRPPPGSSRPLQCSQPAAWSEGVAGSMRKSLKACLWAAGAASLVCLAALLRLAGPLGTAQAAFRRLQLPIQLAAGLPVSSAAARLEACAAAAAAEPRWGRTAARYGRLPRLAIVLSSTQGRNSSAVVSNLAAYADRHGYHFHHAIIDPEEWGSAAGPLHFFTARCACGKQEAAGAAA